ncbi:MAG: M48 family metallopeptidase [Rikenellaceae bacterium]
MVRQAPSRVVVEHDRLGSVTINRSARARRVSISVTAQGDVRLTFPVSGRNSSVEFAMEFLEGRVEWVLAARQRVLRANEGRAGSVPIVDKGEIELLRSRAKSYLPERLQQLAVRYGFKYGVVSVRLARTKWGSCRGNNDISLSLFLMTLPPHLIDFVLIHELCHTVHHNHSPQFHALVDRCVGGRERELHNELRQYPCGARRREKSRI